MNFVPTPDRRIFLSLVFSFVCDGEHLNDLNWKVGQPQMPFRAADAVLPVQVLMAIKWAMCVYMSRHGMHQVCVNAKRCAIVSTLVRPQDNTV
jgi:hypothetical protein